MKYYEKFLSEAFCKLIYIKDISKISSIYRKMFKNRRKERNPVDKGTLT